jgi:transposase
MAKRNDIDLWFQDECHFQQHGTRCKMWIPSENKDPVLLHAPTRKSVAVFGAVRASDGHFASCLMSTFNAETFQLFLAQLIRHKRKGKTIVVIVDNASWHKSRELQPWLEAHKGIIRLDYLPPYSPDLNAIERVWKLTRRLRTHNRYFKTLDELIETVCEQFKAWSRPNETLRKLCAII